MSHLTLWHPIKSFPTDETSIGVNRLNDAISTFGAELAADMASPAGDALDFEKLGVTLAHGLARMSHLLGVAPVAGLIG
ncbi:MAG: hypothetical protein H7Y89_01830 [Steroidobacteraceae bacterium]|nr:hypothetical protein [Steroidobacteraceae bacterium]